MCEFSFMVIFAVYFFLRVGQWCQLSIQLSESSLNKLTVGLWWHFPVDFLAVSGSSPLLPETFAHLHSSPLAPSEPSVGEEDYTGRSPAWPWLLLLILVGSPERSCSWRICCLPYMGKLDFQLSPVFCIGESSEGHSVHNSSQRIFCSPFITAYDDTWWDWSHCSPQ